MRGRCTVAQRTARVLSAEGQWGVVAQQPVHHQTPARLPSAPPRTQQVALPQAGAQAVPCALSPWYWQELELCIRIAKVSFLFLSFV